ncbi:hypothetical protein SEUCBS139899_000934 [Sporothrix eucalyptigena]|uniref:tRNA N(3)-methylcytidine methyltransferase n=1 Tax=Sporothrix eucalyptigena TaxID=1812306 RepID=A0ABP0BJ68_9PEZI
MADQASVAAAGASQPFAAENVATNAVASLAISNATDNKIVDTETPVAPVPAETLAAAVTDVPAHRSHDPTNNAKRTDPFMFGQRFLTQEDDVFEYNAWDHVETDDAFKEYSEKQYELQRSSPVSDFDKSRFNGDPAKWWNLFYKNNTANFFKDRKWLHQEFPILTQICEPDAGPKTILEIGAGAGNTAFPILARNKNPLLRIHACDFSKTAVDVMRKDEGYDTKHMQADVWDVAGTGDESMPPGLGPASVDVAILVFIFSALSPSQWKQAVENVARLVKPGGTVCFRDYGRGDLAQVRFRKGRYLEENFYIRGDGTRVYFFEKDELVKIWTGKPEPAADGEVPDEEEKKEASAEEAETFFTEDNAPFTLEDMGVDRRLIVNRAMKLKMYRCWLQGRFRRK